MDLKNINLGNNITFEKKNGFGLITLNREERANSLTLNMIKNLKEIILFCQDNENFHGIIITGKGSSFTTGLDLDSINSNDKKSIKQYEETAADIARLLFNGKPVITAINGKSMGDGVFYALCSEYRIATKNSYFMMPEVKSGIFPGAATIVIMTKILGLPWTKKILMFSEKIDVEKALEIGLIDEIVQSKEELVKRALEKSKYLAARNQSVIRLTKLCINHLGNKPYNKAYDLEKQALLAWMDNRYDKKFLNKFLEKLVEK